MQSRNQRTGFSEYAIPVIFAVVLAILILWFVPPLVTKGLKIEPKELVELENKLRTTLAQIIGGIVVLVGVYLTFRRVHATEENVRVLEEGQITERFTRAVEQLGSDKIEIRLGGIYALERITKDSQKDHWTVMEVLTAFIRQNAKWEGIPKEENSQDQSDVGGGPRLPVDIQAALTVIGRRELGNEDEKTPPLDLVYTDLRKARLNQGHFDRARFNNSNLEKSHLIKAHFNRASFFDGRLDGAFVWSADLKGADFSFASLEGTDLNDAHLEGAEFYRTNLAKADLKDAHLEGADLSSSFGLNQEQIDSAFLDENTKLPEGLARKEEKQNED